MTKTLAIDNTSIIIIPKGQWEETRTVNFTDLFFLTIDTILFILTLSVIEDGSCLHFVH